MVSRIFIAIFCLLAQPICMAFADVNFESDVLPILKEHCIDCHGSQVQESKLRLDTLLNALRGGDSGEPVISPGNSARSHLIERITNTNAQLRMPPDADPLPQVAIDVLRAWIDNESLWSDARQELSNKKSDHWSFQPLKRPTVPQVSGVSLHNPIDGFIQSRLSEVTLALSPLADKRRLIRRLYLVMHGLPPTTKEVEQFIQDETADAWKSLVERVLESPRYGERMATHWLDLVRFGETNGFETNRERPTAYPYRDWVINAFNTDKPFDRFAREQIAGDALGEPIGTGFLVAGPNDIVKGQDPLLGLMQRQDELADIVNTTGTAFLGLTTGCARCHNHKFDPITQVDYYALQAVFAGVEHGDQELPLSPEAKEKVSELANQIQKQRSSLSKFAKLKGTRDPVSAVENIEQISEAAGVEARFIRFTINATSGSEPCIDELQVFSGDENIALASQGAKASSSGDFVHPFHKLEHLNDGHVGNTRSWIASTAANAWAQIEFGSPARIDRVVWGRDRNRQFADRVATDYRIELSLDGTNWRLAASSADRLPINKGEVSISQYDLEGLTAEQSQSVRDSVAKLKSLEESHRQLSSLGKVYSGRFVQPPETRRLYRGDPTAPREVVGPDAISSLTSLNLPMDAPEQNRRLQLANWIAHRDNPLTARVMVNRVWQFHFGVGLVDTPSDFGANGTKPTHPELLDWMASEFMDSGWSIKALHRLILTSHTWKQDSRPSTEGLAIDAGSRLLWRFPARRLEAEGIRDCILAATGKLDLQVGGPGFSAFEVEMENVRHYFPKKEYGPADWRRMVYMTKVRMERDSTFGVFDCPDGSQVTPRRSRSTTPLQALNLLNSQFVLQQAKFLSERLKGQRESTEGQIQLAYELCFGRQCNDAELKDASEFIGQHGWTQFARALMNANEFVFVP
jgi:Protein of unknown function (DUF1553)/Protein of unknown function (DUF1549)/Planctomycete cytochrome C/F5/8 type C domain